MFPGALASAKIPVLMASIARLNVLLNTSTSCTPVGGKMLRFGDPAYGQKQPYNFLRS